ncbi:MAG: NAD(P)H-hydrate dehydratase [Anaerolineae bacterium]|nr:NAD(P)H-hydrate dehydratase [Phycisphaerae bacterium]
MKRIDTPPPLPERPIDGHKGLFGRVLIVGGSEDMLGAPVLAGTAALRMGSGLVQIAVPGAILASALSITPELIGLGLDKSSNQRSLLEAVERADVLVVGPGLGQSPGSKTRVLRLIRIDKPMVIDADALNILASQKRWPGAFKAQAVLTPHPGEMKRLARLIGERDLPIDDEGRIQFAARAATDFGQIIVLKGHRTIVTDGDRVFVNQTGDSSLSKAGTGDVLSGMIGSLIGQGMDLFDAACAGVHLHGRAGEIAGKKLGRRSVLARDVIETLSAVLS